jgi:thiol-disulfide isomerase/thioredoxin
MKNIILMKMLLVSLLFLTGCNSEAENNASCDGITCNAALETTKTTNVEKVEIFHFHGNHQCTSCIAVGQLAEETVNTYFADELKSGKIVFRHINAELPENRQLAMSYGVTGSSLWIGAYDENGFHKEENTNVWYKINNKQGYMTYLKALIEKRLSGDYS